MTPTLQYVPLSHVVFHFKSFPEYQWFLMKTAVPIRLHLICDQTAQGLSEIRYILVTTAAQGPQVSTLLKSRAECAQLGCVAGCYQHSCHVVKELLQPLLYPQFAILIITTYDLHRVTISIVCYLYYFVLFVC